MGNSSSGPKYLEEVRLEAFENKNENSFLFILIGLFIILLLIIQIKKDIKIRFY